MRKTMLPVRPKSRLGILWLWFVITCDLWFVDSWSRAPDHIQMYPDRETIAQLLPAHGIQQHVCFCHIWLFKGKSNYMTKSTWCIFPRETSWFCFFSSPDLSKRSGWKQIVTHLKFNFVLCIIQNWRWQKNCGNMFLKSGDNYEFQCFSLSSTFLG